MELLTAKDIQKYFSCGKNRAYNIIHTNGFPTIRIGKRLYIPKQEFEKWLNYYKYKEIQL